MTLAISDDDKAAEARPYPIQMVLQKGVRKPATPTRNRASFWLRPHHLENLVVANQLDGSGYIDMGGGLTLPGSNFIEGSTRYPGRVSGSAQGSVLGFLLDSLPSRYSALPGVPRMTSGFVDFRGLFSPAMA